MTYQWWESIPGPKGHEEAKPREEEHSAIDVDDVEEGKGSGLVGNRVDLRCLEKRSRIEHDGGCTHANAWRYVVDEYSSTGSMATCSKCFRG